MITIIKDGEKIRCSQNTYDTMYKRLGYDIVVEKSEEKKNTKVKTRTRTRTKKGE